MKIEILCTGDEIVSGKTVNTNYSYIATMLNEFGFEVEWGTTVGDHRTHLLTAFRQAGARADAVIVNGGLGPTVDDLSQEVAAAAAGVELELNEEWLERIRESYRAWNRTMPANNSKQAMLPVGAELIDNPIGTACGFALDIEGARFYFTPGVPRELHRMLPEQVLPRLQALRGKSLYSRLKRFHTFGLGESRADQLLAGVEDLDTPVPVRLGFQSHYPQLETKLSVRGEDESSLEASLVPGTRRVRELLGDYLLSEDDLSLDEVVGARLEAREQTISVVEIGNAGAVSARLSRAAGGLFNRALVGNDDMDLPGVDARPWCSGGERSAEDYGRLAHAVRDLGGSNMGMAVVVLPLELPDQGFRGSSANIAIVNDKRVDSRRARLPGGTAWAQTGATELALDCLRRFLFDLPVYQRIDFELHDAPPGE